MESKAIALTITFTAIAIALNAVKIPTIFYPNTSFQFSQIPIVIAFLLLGVRVGVLVGFLNLLGSLALFPLGAPSLVVYPMDFVSLLVMFAGLCLAIKLKRSDRTRPAPVGRKQMATLTAAATVFRGGIMPIIDYGIVFHVLLPLVVGINRPEAFIIALAPIFVLYNVIVALYTVSVGYIIAVKVGLHLKMESPILNES